MIYRIVKKNTLVPFALLPVLMVVFWGKALFSPSVAQMGHDSPMPLCDVAYYLFAGRPVLTSIMSLFLLFISIFGLNRMNTKHQLLKRQGIIPGFTFLIFVSGYSEVQRMLDVWFFVTFFVFAIDRLLSATSKRETSVDVFNAILLVSIGSLFFGKGIYFIPMFIWILAVLNIFNLRNVLAAILGLLLPYALSFGVYFFIRQETVFFNNVLENIGSPVAFFDHSVFSKIYNALLVFFIFISILVMVRMLNTLKIITRKFLRVFIWIVIYTILLAATPFYSMEVIPIIGVGASLLIANYFESFRSTFWQEVVFTLFVSITIASQYLS